MAGSGGAVEFGVDRSAEEGTPMVVMAALDAERRPPSNRARARELQRSEKRLVERSKGSNFQILLCLAASRASRSARSLAVFFRVACWAASYSAIALAPSRIWFRRSVEPSVGNSYIRTLRHPSAGWP